MKKLFFLLISIFFISNTLFAEEVKFTASAPKVVEVGERFNVAFSANKKGKDIKLPYIKGFRILMGPSVSQVVNRSYNNGKFTKHASYTYTYVLLAEEEGKFSIDPAGITIDGEQYKSNSLNIEVVKASAQSQSQSNQNNRSQSSSEVRITKENLFLRIELNRKSVYMGEHMVASLKLYSRVPVVDLNNFKLPSFNGFLNQEIPTQIKFERESYKGKAYDVAVIKKMVIFPQHSGKITIEPFELDCIVRQKSTRKNRSVFDDFFNNYQDFRVPRKSKSVTVTVKDFPANKPASFDGAVGKFNVQASIDKDSVAANDAITLKVKISGNGNLKLIKPLDFDFPADFEVYDPTTKQDLKNTAGGTSGSTSFEYLIIPRHGGEYEIPSVDFSYFDPKARIYRTRSTPNFKVKVGKGKSDATGTVISSFSKEDVKFIGKDIRFIKTNDFTPRLKGEVFFGTTNFYLAYTLPLLAFLLAFVFNRKRIQANADIAKVKNKRANKVALKRLKMAAARLKSKQKEEFYDEILKALWGYTSDKLNLPLADLSKDNITEYLQTKGVDQTLIEDFLNILDTCEFARYAPSSGSSEMDQLYQKTMETITKLEKSI
jgi:hypothetical protein